MIRRILSVGGWTLASRATGFARDIMLAAFMGAGPVADAFVVAFRLPNHFRAIFGEGAFNAAFIPSYGRIHELRGEAPARRFADCVFTLMLLVQLVILGVILAATPGFVRLLAPGLAERPATFELAVALTRITFPYLLLITQVTLVSAILNAHDRFWAAAAAPILLNVSMMAALAVSFLFPSAGHAAAWGVTISGLLQLAVVWLDAKRARLTPHLAVPRRSPELGGFFRQLGPAVVGSAGVQVAMFADTIIASALPTGALSALYYAERLYQLPLGVVGIAAGTVLLPTMTRLIASGDPRGAFSAQNRAVALTLAIAAPCAAAFMAVPELILSALFQRGAFDAEAAQRAGTVLAAYSIGLPAAVIIRSSTASFYARGDTRTPLWASLTGYGVNILVKVALMGALGVTGLAIGTSVGVWINLVIVWVLALRRHYAAPSPILWKTIVAIAIASAAIAAFARFAEPLVFDHLAALGGLRTLGTLAILVAGAGLIYPAIVLVALRAMGATPPRLRLRR